jgi:CcmD family protein
MSGTAVILGAILVIWFGVLGYLVALDRKLTRLDRRTKPPEPSGR